MFRLPSHLTLPSAVWIELLDNSCQQILGQRVCFVSILLSSIHSHCSPISREKLSEILPFLDFCLFACFFIVYLLETLGCQVRTQILSLFSGFATDSLALSRTGCTHDVWSSISLYPCKVFFIENKIIWHVSALLLQLLHCWQPGQISEVAKRGVFTAKPGKN